MKKYLEYILPNKHHLIGFAVIFLVLLIMFGIISVNHNKYQELNNNFSDNMTENNYSNISENRYYYDNACWLSNYTNLSQKNYSDLNQCIT